MNEEWKDIEGYEGLYQVSNLGRIKSLPRENLCIGRAYIRRGMVLKGKADKDGYLYVFLSKKGKQSKRLIHRVVAKHFIDNPQNLPQVNHKNEVVDDNRVENLEWCDCKYNIRYGTGIQRRAQLQKNKHGAKKVLQYTLDGKFLKAFPSTMEVVRVLGYGQSHINECCLGKSKSAYGFIWRYEK